MGTITNISTDGKGRKVVAEPCLEPCPIERGMRLLGGKWHIDQEMVSSAMKR